MEIGASRESLVGGTRHLIHVLPTAHGDDDLSDTSQRLGTARRDEHGAMRGRQPHTSPARPSRAVRYPVVRVRPTSAAARGAGRIVPAT